MLLLYFSILALGTEELVGSTTSASSRELPRTLGKVLIALGIANNAVQLAIGVLVFHF